MDSPHKGKLRQIINKQQDKELVVGLIDWLDLGPGKLSIGSGLMPSPNNSPKKRLGFLEEGEPSKKSKV